MLTINRPVFLENHQVYSKSRTARILGLKTEQIEFIAQINNKTLLVGLYNDFIRIATVQYHVEYIKERKRRSINENHKVTKGVRYDLGRQEYIVESTDGSLKTVYVYPHALTCSCKDYENSVKSFGNHNVACKHTYSVLNTMGYNSLQAYLNR